MSSVAFITISLTGYWLVAGSDKTAFDCNNTVIEDASDASMIATDAAEDATAAFTDAYDAADDAVATLTSASDAAKDPTEATDSAVDTVAEVGIVVLASAIFFYLLL